MALSRVDGLSIRDSIAQNIGLSSVRPSSSSKSKILIISGGQSLPKQLHYSDDPNGNTGSDQGARNCEAKVSELAGGQDVVMLNGTEGGAFLSKTAYNLSGLTNNEYFVDDTDPDSANWVPGPELIQLTSLITSSGYDFSNLDVFHWGQGESEASYIPSYFSIGSYKATVLWLFDYMRDLCGGQVKVVIQPLSHRESSTPSGWYAIKNLQKTLANSFDWITLASTSYDLALFDKVHLSSASAATYGTRLGYAIASALGYAVPYRYGPKVGNVSVSGKDIYLDILSSSGNALSSAVNLINTNGFTSGAGWTLSDTVLTGAAATGFVTQASILLEEGATYVVSYEIENYTSGSIRVLLYDNSHVGVGVTNNTAGVHKEEITVSSTTGTSGTYLTFQPTAAFTGVIDLSKVSVTKKGAVTELINGSDLTPSGQGFFSIEDSSGNDVAITSISVVGKGKRLKITSSDYLLNDFTLYGGKDWLIALDPACIVHDNTPDKMPIETFTKQVSVGINDIKNIPSLVMYLDADDSAMTLSGSDVLAWADLSGNGVNAIQDGSNNVPQLVTRNNHNAIYNDANSTGKLKFTTPVDNTNSFTIISLFEADASSTDGTAGSSMNVIWALGGADTSDNSICLRQSRDILGDLTWLGYGSGSSMDGNPQTSANVYTISTDITNVYGYEGEVEDGASPKVAGGIKNIEIDGYLFNESPPSSQRYGVGWMSAYLIFNEKLSDAQLFEVVRYLKNKFGVS